MGGACQSAGAQRALVHPLQAVLKAGDVPLEHIGVGHHVVAEGDGLGTLEVGIAGHDSVCIPLRLLHQHRFQLEQHVDDLGNFGADVHPEVHRHLVVPAAAGVEPLAGGPQPLGQQGLDIHMDVLVVLGELHLTRLHIGKDRPKAVHNGSRLLSADDALLPQHGGVGDRAGNVLPVHPGVKADGGIEVVDQRISLFVEASAP